MNTLTIMLSNSAHKKALELARVHGVPVVAYLSTELENLLDNKLNGHQCDSPSQPATPIPQPNFSPVMPDTLSQVIAVCKYVYINRTFPTDEVHARYAYQEAVRSVAKELHILETTVRDKCATERRLGLPGVSVNTDIFVAWLSRPENLRDHLCRKFPNFAPEIHRRFAEWLPDRFLAQATHPGV